MSAQITSKMQTAFVNINSVQTPIITWGCWIEESFDDVTEIAICVTGNPGLPGFYTEFGRNLIETLGQKMPVWVIGHAGHEEPSAKALRQVPQLKGNEKLYNLDGQIKHKIEFIEKYVPNNVKIHFIGHSIGAWMILQLLQVQQIRERVQKCYMLFPTVEKMLESPNGWLFTKIAMPLYSVFGFLITVFHMLPVIVRSFVIKLYFSFCGIPYNCVGTVLKYLKPSVIEKVVFLADDEMANVNDLQHDIIKNNLHLLKFYYGETDGWVPIKYYEQLKCLFPNIDAQLDTKGIAHAFVLKHSNLMAQIVGDMIKQNSSIW